MSSRSRRRFTPEFKAEVVELVNAADGNIAQVAKELGIYDSTLGNWVKQDRIDRGNGRPGELTSDQLEELRRLRRRVADLEAEREILRRAAAYFAKEMGR